MHLHCLQNWLFGQKESGFGDDGSQSQPVKYLFWILHLRTENNEEKIENVVSKIGL